MTVTDGNVEHAADTDLDVVQARLATVTTVAELADVIRTYARHAADADGATFVLREDDRCFYVDEDSIAPLWKGQRFPIAECLSGWAMLHAEVVVVPDISVDLRIPREAYRPTFVQSLVMVPVSSPPAAAIGAYWARQHRATREQQRRLRELAECAATTLERIGVGSAPWAPSFSTS